MNDEVFKLRSPHKFTFLYTLMTDRKLNIGEYVYFEFLTELNNLPYLTKLYLSL